MTNADSTDQSRSRRESRERAVELGYEAQVRGWEVDDLLEAQTIAPDRFVVELLRDAESKRPEVDALIEAKSNRWSISRMPVLDVVVMRIGVAELLSRDTPTGVVLSEAVELAGRYSTDESSRYVNSVFAAIAADLRPGS